MKTRNIKPYLGKMVYWRLTKGGVVVIESIAKIGYKNNQSFIIHTDPYIGEEMGIMNRSFQNRFGGIVPEKEAVRILLKTNYSPNITYELITFESYREGKRELIERQK